MLTQYQFHVLKVKPRNVKIFCCWHQIIATWFFFAEVLTSNFGNFLFLLKNYFLLGLTLLCFNIYWCWYRIKVFDVIELLGDIKNGKHLITFILAV